MESTNKKRTAVVAAATAAALVLTGTFAWVMKNDQTKLNKFTAKDPGTYEVELKEDFDPNNPWANKDVWVENKGDNPVIVRVRLEEFYDLEFRNGTTYNIKEGYSQGSDNGSAIFKVPGGSELADDLTADSSTGIDKNVILKFGENGTGVTTMEKWNAMDANAKAAVKWVIDKDGWCYYTKALLYGEKTSHLLDDVDFNEDLFLKSHSKPYNLDYKINVRLQAISADLEDFGSHLNDMQWTNVAYIDADGNEVTDNAGRVITEDERADNYEILADSTITDEAMALVTGIAYGFATPYTEGFKNADGSVAKRVSNVQELNAAINDPGVHSILLTNDITIANAPDEIIGVDGRAGTYAINSVTGNKMIDLGEYKFTVNDGWTSLFRVSSNLKLSIKHGDIYVVCPLFQNYGDIELVGVDAQADAWGARMLNKSSIKLYGSNMSIINAGGYGAIWANNAGSSSGQNIYLNNSKISGMSANVYAVYSDAGQTKDVTVTVENNSTLEGAGEGLGLGEGWILNASDSNFSGTANGIYMGYNSTANLTNCTVKGAASSGIFVNKNSVVNAKDCTIEGREYGVGENHEYTPKGVSLENCTIRSNVGYYKPANSKLTMRNCVIEAAGIPSTTDTSGGKAVGLCIRCGDVTLDNVQVTTSQGTFSDSDSIWTDQQVIDRYNSESGSNGPFGNFEAMQIILNNYDDLNLNIIGGSYTATYQGHDSNNNPVTMRSIYVQDCTYSIHGTDGYDYNNTITISGDPTFTPATTAFDTDYANTTIIKND